MDASSSPRRFGRSLSALALLFAAPFLGWLAVDTFVPAGRCGTFSLTCFLYLLLAAMAGWLAGVVLGILGLRRGEVRWLAWTALVLNALPLLWLAVVVSGASAG